MRSFWRWITSNRNARNEKTADAKDKLFIHGYERRDIRKGIRFFATTAIGLSLMVAALTNANAAFDPEKNPEWCRPGYRCLSIQDYAHMTEVKINLEYEVKHLKSRRTFHTLGAEYLPGGTVEPYGLTGLNFGPISLWGGFFGKQPALGVGFSW